ncbi:glutathione S-transferase family protein [Aspergillus sclerotiicarbonarius CBS 121057]|uniref:Glutathione S-transferase family protein n=1 Tax=Aspergillus sclerotiicarbonarius (strain CBS 121057 / IBT 28362) TaxID=1448318 RepID=A0A319ES25_ASPSB|nr:glutathione S-transferase family protein [Aspergillus sclerotiicarbonarius CBS 121057]
MSAPFTLYTHAGPGPNPIKVAIVLEYLGLSYTTIPLKFGEGKGTVKDPEYTAKINPNGRVPALIDHGNDDLVVFESGAILQYLAEKEWDMQYDQTGNLSGRTPSERAQINQWLSWQISGLGPYQGQLAWFVLFHEQTHGEKPNGSVITRYQAEVERLRTVLDEHLGQAEGGYVAAGRVTIADFAILPWLKVSVLVGEKLRPLGEYRALKGYVDRLEGMEGVRGAYERLGVAL